MTLAELIGSSYNENMTMKDLETALQGKNLADLSSGNYIDVNKYNREIQDLQDKLSKAQQPVKSEPVPTVTPATDENNTLIEQLQQEIKNLQEKNNRSNAKAGVSDMVSLLGIKNDDSELDTFLSSVSALDENVSSSIVTYMNKQVKSAYEKGKTDSLKTNLGEMGKQPVSSANKTDAVGSFGKQLAQSLNQTQTYDYFKRK